MSESHARRALFVDAVQRVSRRREWAGHGMTSLPDVNTPGTWFSTVPHDSRPRSADSACCETRPSSATSLTRTLGLCCVFQSTRTVIVLSIGAPVSPERPWYTSFALSSRDMILTCSQRTRRIKQDVGFRYYYLFVFLPRKRV